MQRHESLLHTLRTILDQSFDDFEVVVADNASDEQTQRTVESLNSNKLRWSRTSERLTMSDNWERGLELARGQFLLVLGDDDGLMPEALRLAHAFLTQTGSEIVTWFPHQYWWPEFIYPPNRNMLCVNLPRDHHRIDARVALTAFLQHQETYFVLPGLYNSFMSRRAIDAVRSRVGRYFADPIPDVYSGIVNAFSHPEFIRSGRALSISGFSKKSIGSSKWCYSQGKNVREDYIAAERKRVADLCHPALIESWNIEIIIGSVTLRACELLGIELPPMESVARALLVAMGSGLNRDPDSYDIQRSDMDRLAAKYGLTIEPEMTPPKVVGKIVFPQGPQFRADGSLLQLNINGAWANAANIYDACRLAHAVQPSLD